MNIAKRQLHEEQPTFFAKSHLIKNVNPNHSLVITIWFGLYVFGGDKGSRTPDLLNAIQTRYQLRYIPVSFFIIP